MKLIFQQKTITNTKNNMERMGTSINKINELLKSTKFNNNNYDTVKITFAFEECQNFVKNMGKGLNVDINNNKANYNNNNIIDILKKSLQKENLIADIKNIKDKKLPQKLFKQYFINLSKFSKAIVDYGINDDDSKE